MTGLVRRAATSLALVALGVASVNAVPASSNAAAGGTLELANGDGFGNANNIGVGRVYTSQGYLFAGTWNEAEGMIVYRSRDGEHFEQISQPGINGNPNNFVAQSFIWFKGKLYVSSWNNVDGGSIFRANANAADPDDIVWETIALGGLGNPQNSGIHMNLVFKGHLYVGTFNFEEGTEVWRTKTGHPGSWVQVNQPGYGDPRCNVDSANMIQHGGYLYVGVETAGCFFARPPRSGTRLLRTDGNLSPPYDQWEQVNVDGFGNEDNHNIIGLNVFKGHLYAATWNVFDGTEVWRAKIGPVHKKELPFPNWEQVNENGFGSPALNQATNYMISHGGVLYLIGYAQSGPGQGFFFKTRDGTTWEEITGPGWPPARGPGSGPYWATVFHGDIYVAVHRGNGPGQLWVYEP